MWTSRLNTAQILQGGQASFHSIRDVSDL